MRNHRGEAIFFVGFDDGIFYHGFTWDDGLGGGGGEAGKGAGPNSPALRVDRGEGGGGGGGSKMQVK